MQSKKLKPSSKLEIPAKPRSPEGPKERAVCQRKIFLARLWCNLAGMLLASSKVASSGIEPGVVTSDAEGTLWKGAGYRKARRDGNISGHGCVSDAQGRYSFPANRLQGRQVYSGHQSGRVRSYLGRRRWKSKPIKTRHADINWRRQRNSRRSSPVESG